LKKFSKDELKPWMTNYCSTSRHIFRNAWFLNFLYTLINELTTNREIKMTKVGQTAYSVALAPHHPWALRKIVSLAMNAMTNKTSFLNSIVEE
jgi:hypothetical protein